MKAWRESASLIIAARHGQKYNRTVSPAIYNYDLLCLRRSQNSKFMPGFYVFPGGVIEPADADLKWREFFARFGLDSDTLASLIPRTVTRPQIFRPQQNELPREISLRITAIRETFEECGVLVCRRKDSAPTTWAQHVSLPDNELKVWRTKVHDNAAEFFKLCERFECYPDLWTLREWSNWLTPTSLKRRYDTAFYLACMSTIPQAEYETAEMQDLKWGTPEYFLSSTEVRIPIPQMYDLTKLTEFKDMDSLLSFSMERNKAGVQLFFPISVSVKDGFVHVLPGDDLYPKEGNLGTYLTEEKIIDKSDYTIDEIRKMTAIKNRVEWPDMESEAKWPEWKKRRIVVDDIQNRDSHMDPTVQKTGQPHIKNKL